jgi:Flp pilus assembly protein TadD
MIFMAFLFFAQAPAGSTRPASAAKIQQGLKANPSWQEGWWELGTLDYQQDRYAECRDAFKQLGKLAPKSGAAWTMLGLCEFGAKQFDAALIHLRQGQDLRVGNDAIDTVAKFHLAQLYTHVGNFEMALSILADLAQHKEESSSYIMASGIAALWKPIFPEELQKEDRELVYLAGKAFWDAGARKAVDAQRGFETLAGKYPESPGVHYLYGSFELANNPDHALLEFERELAISPRHLGALSAIAMEYLRRGDSAKGLPYARKCEEFYPDALACHVILGRTLADSGDLQEGARELESAKQLDPADPQARIALASVYAKLGREDDAARERREFLRLKEKSKRPGDP